MTLVQIRNALLNLARDEYDLDISDESSGMDIAALAEDLGPEYSQERLILEALAAVEDAINWEN